jgi:hypothetical protein
MDDSRGVGMRECLEDIQRNANSFTHWQRPLLQARGQVSTLDAVHDDVGGIVRDVHMLDTHYPRVLEPRQREAFAPKLLHNSGVMSDLDGPHQSQLRMPGAVNAPESPLANHFKQLVRAYALQSCSPQGSVDVWAAAANSVSMHLSHSGIRRTGRRSMAGTDSELHSEGTWGRRRSSPRAIPDRCPMKLLVD